MRRFGIPVVLDIETEADHAWLAATEETWLQHQEPPSNWKDPAKIAKWFEDAKADRVTKAALNPLDGRLTAWSCMRLQEDLAGAEQVTTVDRKDECTLLQCLFSVLDNLGGGNAVLAGFNIGWFDLPFLAFRAALHRVPLPPWWPDPRRREAILDAHQILDAGKLELVLTRLGLPQKLASGSQVGQMLDHELEAYVAQDVVAEASLLLRLAEVHPVVRAYLAPSAELA